MLKHVVCFKFKDEYKDQIEKTKDMILDMNGKVPSLVSVEAGADIIHSERSYDLVLISTHKSKEDLDEYQKDPVHMKLKEHLAVVTQSAVSVDFME